MSIFSFLCPSTILLRSGMVTYLIFFFSSVSRCRFFFFFVFFFSLSFSLGDLSSQRKKGQFNQFVIESVKRQVNSNQRPISIEQFSLFASSRCPELFGILRLRIIIQTKKHSQIDRTLAWLKVDRSIKPVCQRMNTHMHFARCHKKKSSRQSDKQRKSLICLTFTAT